MHDELCGGGLARAVQNTEAVKEFDASIDGIRRSDTSPKDLILSMRRQIESGRIEASEGA